MGKSKTKIEQLKYEQAIAQLESLIERIESGEVGLEESLEQYETGVALIRRCRSILVTAEQKIAELKVGEDGQLAVQEGDDPTRDEPEETSRVNE